MADLIIKPATGDGNKLILQDKAGGAVLTTADSGATIANVTLSGDVLPSTDATQDLGSASLQWRDIYTGDLNLNNTRHRKNEVDGTSGSWTIQEGEDDLFLLNRINGKKYKFNLTEVK